MDILLISVVGIKTQYLSFNVTKCFSLEPQVRSIANNVRPDRQSEYYLLFHLVILFSINK